MRLYNAALWWNRRTRCDWLAQTSLGSWQALAIGTFYRVRYYNEYHKLRKH